MVPIETEQTKAQQFIAQLGWASRPSGSGENYAIQTCPLCGNTNWKFFMAIGGEKDGLWSCKVCGEDGNLYQLKERLGVVTNHVMSVHDAATANTKPSPLPNFDSLHNRLMTDSSCGEVLDYLVAGRKFSIDVLTRFKIGAQQKDGCWWFVIPYLDAADNPVYYKARTVPPAKKKFDSPHGREAPLFNERVVKEGLDELVIVEGESDALSLLSQGYETVVGVPGAGVKKAAWIDKLDSTAPKQIYLLYDRDKVGQQAAREMANRIGIDKVKNILLPEFFITLPDGNTKPGKDINEYFAVDNTLDDFQKLKGQAKAFDVQGVQSLVEVLTELRDEIEGKGVEPTYKAPWAGVNKIMGGMEEGDLIGIMAEGKVGKTTLGLNWIDWLAATYDITTMMFCQEMQPRRVVRKWVSMITQTDDTPGASEITSAVVDSAIIFGGSRPGDLLFGYTKMTRTEEVFETIRLAVRRYGVKVVCFDNLQLLIRSVEHSAQETSKITKMFKALAMELNIIILLVIQPNRVPEGQIISARNAMGSSAIEKDVDVMLCLHRNRVGCGMKQSDFTGFIEITENFEPQMLVRADLTRFAPGGATTLFMDGARSTVREITASDMNTIVLPKAGSGIPIEA